MSGTAAAFTLLFVGVAWLFAMCFARMLEVTAESKREADALAEYLRSQKQPDTSSLMDDSPAPLPEKWETSGGHVVEFRPKQQKSA